MWHIAKNHLEEKQCKNVEEMKREISQLWHNDITRELCMTLARSMPNRLQAMLTANGVTPSTEGSRSWSGGEGGRGANSKLINLYPTCQ